MQGLVAFKRSSDYTDDRVEYPGADPMLQMRRPRLSLRLDGE